MNAVKTCATCRHSVVGRRDQMDWWKRRLCAHPGLVDRVEGRPIYEAVEARGKDGACGLAGALWEAVPAEEDRGTLLDPVDNALIEIEPAAIESINPFRINPAMIPRPTRRRKLEAQ